MEGYHIRDVHPKLSQAVSTKDYRVFVGKRGRFAVHKVPMKDESAFEGGTIAIHSSPYIDQTLEWIWLYPAVGMQQRHSCRILLSCRTALNLYKNCASIERMMPLGPRTMQLHYSFVSNDQAAYDLAEKAKEGRYERNFPRFQFTLMFDSELLTLEDKRICEIVQRNLESGTYKAGPLRYPQASLTIASLAQPSA